MDNSTILEFLTALRVNNSLEWMTANKKWYDEAKTQFAELVQTLITRLSETDRAITHLAAKDLLFRLNRDTRFSHDKSPYNPPFRAHISPGGRVPIPVGYYINVAPNNIFLGGGLFAVQFPDATGRVRDYIVQHGNELERILTAPEISSIYPLLGEKLKNVPRGYPSDHPQAEYLKHKSWDIEYHIDNAAFEDVDGFICLAVEQFILMRPFNDFFNKALAGYKMPERKPTGGGK
jgi:uncharacterized protein (TIGR02453 family)